MLIEIKDVSVIFGTNHALNDLTVNLEGGAIGLLGPNGAGKSTLLKMLLGFVTPSQGEAKLFGLDVKLQQEGIREQVGYMPEDDCLIPQMNAVQLVSFAGEICGMPTKDAMQRAHEVLFYVGVDEERYRPISGYSTGMRQRVKLAQALIHDPKLLLLDEPTNGMDTAGREEMLLLIKDIAEDKGINVVLSSHLLPDVESVCQEIFALSNGNLAVKGNIEELRRDQTQAFDLKIVGDQETFIETLGQYSFSTEIRTDGRLRVTSTSQDRIEGTFFFKLAHETGIQLRQLREVEHTLEDVFAEVMHQNGDLLTHN